LGAGKVQKTTIEPLVRRSTHTRASKASADTFSFKQNKNLISYGDISFRDESGANKIAKMSTILQWASIAGIKLTDRTIYQQ
jgi:hypothetical protein